jgi:hypothetical protein
LGTNTTCPTCRFSLKYEDYEDDEWELNIYHNKALHRMIHNMQVKCPNSSHDHTDAEFQNARSNEEERACQRRKLDDRGGFQEMYKPSSSDDLCTWTGCLGDWQEKHKEECHLEKIECVVPGCEFECLRKDMDEHLDKGSGRLEHMKLMVKQETQKIRESIIEELEEKNESEKEDVIREYQEKIDKMEKRITSQEHQEKIDKAEKIINGISTFVRCLPLAIGPAVGTFFFLLSRGSKP